MFRFSAAVFAALVAGATASLPLLVTYEPQTNVADHAAIAYDQEFIEKEVGFKTEGSFAIAQTVYEQGGNSKSYVELTLTENLATTVEKGTDLNIGTKAYGQAYKTYDEGSSIIGFRYGVTEAYEANVECKVGGLKPDARLLTGCIEEATGTLTIDGSASVDYKDYVVTDNENGRTIQGFSTAAEEKFRPDKDPTKDYYAYFAPAVEYYGSPDFGDKIVTAAFDGASTSLTNGNVNLEGYSFDARGEIAKKTSAYVVIAHYLMYELMAALGDCENDCDSTNCNDDSLEDLDEAVAFFVGGTQPSDAKGKGNLHYALGEKRAANFKTSADGVTGQANVNSEVMQEFNKIKTNFIAGECADATVAVDKIIALMKVPAIQGILRYGYIQSTTPSPTEKAMAEGMALALLILPYAHACNEADAKTIYDNMSLKANQKASVNFADVKKALEDNYVCMGVTCDDIGGLYDSTVEGYFADAGPCGGGATSGAPAAVTVGGIFVVVAAAMSFFM